MATIPPLVVMLEIVTMPDDSATEITPRIVVMIMNTIAHSLPLTYCINTPVLKPNLGTASGKLCILSRAS